MLHHKGKVSKHLEEASSTITETTSEMSGPDKQRRMCGVRGVV